MQTTGSYPFAFMIISGLVLAAGVVAYLIIPSRKKRAAELAAARVDSPLEVAR